jgi:hypothetical protein
MNANSNLITGGTANGTIMLSSIAVADDGAVYACNIATDESVANLFKLYRWTNSSADAVPALVFQGDPAGQTTSPRWGDTLAARGSGLGTEVFVDSNDGLWAGDLYPIDGTLTNLANHSLFNQLGSGSIGRSLAFGSGESIYQKRNGAGLLLSNFDTNSGAVTIVTNYNNYSSTFGPVGFNLSSNLLCGITFATSNTVPDTLDLFEISDPSQPLYLASYPFPTNHQANANFIGQVIFSGKNVYALDANNGVAAFILTAQPPKLNISLSGSSVTLSWPSSFSGFTLQGSPLVAPTNWTDIGTGTLSGGSYTVTEGVGGTSKFYRLRN